MESFEKLKELVADAQSEIEKFGDKGNKAAGTRARKLLQEIKKSAQGIRIEIQNAKKAQ